MIELNGFPGLYYKSGDKEVALANPESKKIRGWTDPLRG
jgi:hypothetical protein